jgi:hypothetical protein
VLRSVPRGALPTGVRTADTITASWGIVVSLYSCDQSLSSIIGFALLVS